MYQWLGNPAKLNLRLSRIMSISRRECDGAHEGLRAVNGNLKKPSEPTPAVPRIDAATLLASAREIILIHKDTQYRLRITSNDKLILTK